MLWRRWTQGAPPLCFIMLNPSTADGLKDDPTIRRCRSIAMDNGFGGVHVVNLFAYRATHPKMLFGVQRAGTDIVGPYNNDYIRLTIHQCSGDVVLAWGGSVREANKTIRGRVAEVVDLVRTVAIRPPICLGKTAYNQPRHPLMVERGVRFEPY